MNKTTFSKIKSVTILLASAVLTAVLLTFFMIDQYGPTGAYLAGNVILSPEVIHTINYKDKHPFTGQGVSFIFNGIEFSYFDTLQGQLRKIDLTPILYAQFFEWIASEKGLKTISEEDEKAFIVGFPATLTITLRTDSSIQKPATKIFQMIQCVKTDYFRVQLQGEENSEWAYFYKPHIYQEMIDLFTQTHLKHE